MRNMQQGTILQLAPLVGMMESLNENGCNYSLDIMVSMDKATIHYYDVHTDGTQVKGTRMTVPSDDIAWEYAGCSGAEWANEEKDIDIAPDMLVEFEHYVHVLDGIRCTFHQPTPERQAKWLYHMEGHAYSGC